MPCNSETRNKSASCLFSGMFNLAKYLGVTRIYIRALYALCTGGN